MRSISSLLFMLLLVMTAAPARAGELSVGAAAVSITPPVGTPMAGYYVARGGRRASTTTSSPRPSSWKSTATKAALVALDLISTTRDLVEEARRRDRADDRHPRRRA